MTNILNISKIFWLSIFASILFLLLFYVLQVNCLTQEIYLLENRANKLAQLFSENEVLEINFSRSNSLANIENYLQNGRFEKISQSQTKYIQILESAVAAK